MRRDVVFCDNAIPETHGFLPREIDRGDVSALRGKLHVGTALRAFAHPTLAWLPGSNALAKTNLIMPQILHRGCDIHIGMQEESPRLRLEPSKESLTK